MKGRRACVYTKLLKFQIKEINLKAEEEGRNVYIELSKLNQIVQMDSSPIRMSVIYDELNYGECHLAYLQCYSWKV